MDHRVSKDMISSGMTPSGEKTQADLGKTQYGSAPSPNRLMDAYHSMYQNQKEETLDEMVGKGGLVPKKLNPNTKGADLLKKRISGEMSADQVDKAILKSRTKEPSLPKFSKTDNPGFKKPETKSMVDTVRDKRQEVVSDRRERAQKIMSKYGESVDLLAAYYSIYEHHQKDENGNTIPHEDDVKEGKIPAGLQAYLDKKKGKKKDDDDEKKDKKDMKEGAGLYANIHAKRKRGGKMRKKGAKGAPSSQDFANAARTAKEDIDLFDVISGKLIEEGYSEKESYEIMANLTDEQLEKINEAVVTGTLATLGVLGKLLAGGAAKAAVGKGLAAAKGGMMAAKGLAKGAVKGAVSAGKNVVSGTQNIANKALTKVQSIAKSPNKGPKITQSGGNVVQGSDKSKESPLEKLEKNYYRYQMAKSLMPQGSSGSTSVNKTGTVSASTDLFDIVKGQLIDEGLTEQEVVDIMTTLTLDEINETLQLDEITGKLAMQASKAADMKRAQLAKAGDKAGAAAKAAQASRLYKKGAERNLAKQDLSKPLNPQRTDYPMGKGASYQQKPGM